ncbi:MAG TPA: glycosyl hydrolase family 18 protein [Verrucomicrobiae bacterium]|nr:glycosyl hydrolase family 18 protein [Verrucomicrobiae bacterium]
MRDIIVRSHTHSATTGSRVIPHATPPTLLERAFRRINEWGGKLDEQQLPVTGPVLTALPITRKVHTKKRNPYPQKVVRRTTRGVQSAAHTARDELRKPGKKTAIIHTAALGAVFALMLSNTPWNRPSSPADTNTTSTARRYLPAIASDDRLNPLDAGKALAESGQSVRLYGWITPWNVSNPSDNIFNSTSAFWLTVGEDGMSMTPKASWSQWQSYKATYPSSETYLTVSGDPDHTYKALSDLDVQSTHILNLLTAVKEQGFTGIDINYESLGSENRDLFTGFIRNLTTVFHQEKLKVAVTLEARIANQVPMDWRSVGLIADEVRIMAYDYHGKSTGEPGPIAPLSWVAEVAAYAADTIDPKKLVIGLGNYGYDWSAPLTDADNWEGTGISYEQAITLSTEKEAPVIRQTGIDERGYDIGTIPVFTYTDTQGRLHQVWFEDATSIQEKLNAAAAYQLKGIMFWSVGAGDLALWQSRS